MLRKRIDLKVNKYQGSRGSIYDEPLRPPYNICIARKKKRKKSGVNANSVNSNPFVLTNVHYHAKRSSSL